MKSITKCLLLGFVMVGFVGCDSVSGVFDKFNYDEIFEYVSKGKRYDCSIDFNRRSHKFIEPSELADNDKGLIGACVYTEVAHGGLYGMSTVYKLETECKTGTREDITGLSKIDEKSGAWIFENKYKVVTIVESAEFSMEGKYKGICKKRKVYKLQRGQPK